jgi:formate hydrogenlyase transcriptional activator
MVLGPDLTILYANELVWDDRGTIEQRPGTCYETFADRSDPCPICPATQLFHRHGSPPSCSTNEAAPVRCGLQHIVPLRAGDGKTECALVFLKRDRIRPMMVGSATGRYRREGQPSSSDRLGELIGNSAAMQQLFTIIHRVADSEATVLLEGETGTGKELVAKTIHRLSERRHRPFIVVDCGSLTETLLESELFGHVKGAFTGAIDKRVGRFELAHSGTIFLDEVGELPPEAQIKLLRVLQEQEFEPVGSSRTVRVNVRVIAATNRDLHRATSEGRFRADLLYRLNVFPIEVPPLRERRTDIALLTGFFVSSLARKLGKPLEGFSARSMQRLIAYEWPGNVRELQNVVERAAILAQGNVLELEPTLFGEAAPPASVAVPDVPSAAVDAKSLQEIERLHIVGVLKTTGGVVEGARGAAKILDIHPNTLRSRMKKLGIPTPRTAS